MWMDPTKQCDMCETFHYRLFHAALFCSVGFTELEDTTGDRNPLSRAVLWFPQPHLFAACGCEDPEQSMSPWQLRLKYPLKSQPLERETNPHSALGWLNKICCWDLYIAGKR